MFIDSSVIVAILSKEADAAELADRIEVGRCITSALVILESAMRLSTKLNLDPVLVEGRIQAFLEEAQIGLAPMDGITASLAVKAFADYGKGRGHPAQLNLADCLSYACAKAQGVPLLYKGKDFSHTDLA
ncbi:type II toxin-antitoxin system VapC family toxin [Acidiphilium acidophilum]|uniref:Ribonuclease VapC n=1 Tax=Acidiphilium acidophilum TaxID=76588 RepID=A0AAW9DVF0_ACIAO|nr:type II toxin-antitoxin system VapC family toxin [Acidiphilium acidophilum]MDX5933073.1 type II toxin-antitoxin system VapC family toxin [Acidiphilium acidophilum]